MSFGQCVSFILEKSWNRELKVSYLRAPVELDDIFFVFSPVESSQFSFATNQKCFQCIAVEISQCVSFFSLDHPNPWDLGAEFSGWSLQSAQNTPETCAIDSERVYAAGVA